MGRYDDLIECAAQLLLVMPSVGLALTHHITAAATQAVQARAAVVAGREDEAYAAARGAASHAAKADGIARLMAIALDDGEASR